MAWKICLMPTIGNVTSDSNGYLKRHSVEMNLPLHPSYVNRGKWLLGAPYSKYVINVEPYGMIEIPSGSITSAYITELNPPTDNYLTLKLETIFDISTGDCRLECSMKSGVSSYTVFNIMSQNCAVPVPIHQAVQDAMNFRQSRRSQTNLQVDAGQSYTDLIIDWVAGDLSARQAITSAIDISQGVYTNATANIDDATRANAISISGDGTNGSYLSFNSDLCTPKVICYFQELTDEYNLDKGRPLCKVRTLNHLSGFIQCDNPDIQTNGTKEENERIIQYLIGGFFYE